MRGMKLFYIRYASETDRLFWRTLDNHLSESELAIKIRDNRAYIISANDKPAGVMRYNLFWDMIPFLTFIYFKESHRGKGLGRQAIYFWENEMFQLGHKMVMTSTQADEQAQHFYRKLGYKDRGSIFFDNTPFEQPQEIIMLKML